jgi:uncharacterized membrane protein
MSNETTSSPEQGEGVAGVGMMVAAYVDELAADQALDAMKSARKAGNFYYDDAAVVRQDAKGKVHIKETGDMSTGKGAGIGALVGGVIGIIGGPAGVAWGAAGGAAIGSIAAHHDAGFSKDTLKELGGALVPGSSALIATTSQAFVEQVRRQTAETDRMATARDLASSIRDSLTIRNDILLGLVITEAGIAATKVVSSPTEVAIFGIAADESGAVAGQAVVTAEGAAYEVAATDGEDVAYEAGVATEEGAVVVDAEGTIAEEGDDATKEDEES